jgi:hypothetical protein
MHKRTSHVFGVDGRVASQPVNRVSGIPGVGASFWNSILANRKTSSVEDLSPLKGLEA